MNRPKDELSALVKQTAKAREGTSQAEKAEAIERIKKAESAKAQQRP